MRSSAISRLHWKELRTQGVIWLALFTMGIMFAIALFVLVEPLALGTAMDSVLFAAPALFALACGSFAFASEDEYGTIGVLRRLPINSRDVLRAKLGFALVGLLSFYVLFAPLLWLAAIQFKPGFVSVPGHLHYAFWGVEALAWSAFFSMRSRSTFASATKGAATVAFITLVFEVFLTMSLSGQIVGFLFRIMLLGYVVARLIPQSDEWFHDFEIQFRPTTMDRGIGWLHRIQREIGRVIWLGFRENRVLIWISLGVIGSSLLASVFLYLNWRFEEVEELARRYQGPYYQPQLFQYPLPPYFWWMIAATIVGDLFLAALGLIVFGSVRQLRFAPMLSNQGISARWFVATRIALFFGIAIALWVAGAIPILMGMFLNNAPYDGGLVLLFSSLLPGWCFIATLWSSFHSNKKVVAFLAGIFLGTIAAALQFVLGQADIFVSIGGFSIYVWVWVLLIGYTIVFAPSWALQRWGRVRRLAAWSLFPVALAGLYLGTAAYQINDVPDSTMINTFIPEPKDVPDVEVIRSPASIDLRDVFENNVSDDDIAKLTGYRVGGGLPTWIFKPAWLQTDPSSLQWLGRDFERLQTLYRCFPELEPNIQWIRDQLNSKDCVVRGLFENMYEDRNGYHWLLLGAYAKLKDSQPAESLAYARSMIRLATNQRRLSAQKKLWGDEILRSSDDGIEMTALAFLEDWANHPSTKKRPELLHAALALIPEDTEGADLDIFRIARYQDSWQTRLDSGESEYNRGMPVDQRVRLIVRMLVPWETERNRLLLDYAVGIAYQWRTNPIAMALQTAKWRRDRFGKYVGSLRGSDFDMLVESRIAAKERIKKLLADLPQPSE